MKNKTPTFRSLLRQLARTHDTSKVFSAFTSLSACALAHGTREAEYLNEAKLWNKDELEIFSHALAMLIIEMEERPFTDLIGNYYMEFAISRKAQQMNGKFHTPQNICEMMAQALVDNTSASEKSTSTLCEPACGSGAMILAYGHTLTPEARSRLRVTAIDISKTACDMCFINTTLWGIPTEIIHGDALSPEVTTMSSWKNIHWIFQGRLHLFAGLAAMPRKTIASQTENDNETATPLATALLESAAQQQGQPPTPEKIEQIKTALGQQEFSFA